MSAVAQCAPSYTYWHEALKGNFGPVHEGDYQYGFFRKRVSRGGTFVPVAIWGGQDGTICLVDNRAADPIEVWGYCCQYPVTEEQYRQRVASGRWHDEDEAVNSSLAHAAENESGDPAAVLADQIDAAMQGVSGYEDIRDDESAAKAQGLRSRLLELSGQADKERDKQKRPHLEAGRAIDSVFQPLVKKAKEGADAIRKALGDHETRKAREADRIRREQEEAQRKALAEAQKASGTLQPAPVAPAPVPAPEPVPEQTQVRGAYGRAATIKVKRIAVVQDLPAAVAHFQNHPDVVALIQRLSQKALDAGYNVPGVTVDEVKEVR